MVMIDCIIFRCFVGNIISNMKLVEVKYDGEDYK